MGVVVHPVHGAQFVLVVAWEVGRKVVYAARGDRIALLVVVDPLFIFGVIVQGGHVSVMGDGQVLDQMGGPAQVVEGALFIPSGPVGDGRVEPLVCERAGGFEGEVTVMCGRIHVVLSRVPDSLVGPHAPVLHLVHVRGQEIG